MKELSKPTVNPTVKSAAIPAVKPFITTILLIVGFMTIGSLTFAASENAPTKYNDYDEILADENGPGIVEPKIHYYNKGDATSYNDEDKIAARDIDTEVEPLTNSDIKQKAKYSDKVRRELLLKKTQQKIAAREKKKKIAAAKAAARSIAALQTETAIHNRAAMNTDAAKKIKAKAAMQSKTSKSLLQDKASIINH